jgi:N-methylhydantoinase A
VIRAGIDIGGTFTDLCVAGPEGIVHVAKALSTPEEPIKGVEAVLDGVSGVEQTVHATTLVTNALIERKGARTALLATAGFRDVLEMGRERRADLYDLTVARPDPLVPRHLRFDVPERTLADGTVEQPVDEALVARLGEALAARGIEAIAICFLHSFANPANEQAARGALRDSGLRVALSSEVAPEIREFERTSTTVASVYVQDRVGRYLGALDRRLSGLRVMLSNGGVATAEAAAEQPIRMLESGPAAGALAAARFGAQAGHLNLMSFDMGGTTAKLCLIEGGRPLVAHELEVARTHRFAKGSGLPIKAPAIDMIEIGVGGGSIARVNALGLLTVGPDSAGADPGPACYGAGGAAPTVTDADLLLGYLDPGFFLGGGMRLDRDAAAAAVGRLGEDAAWGIHRLVNEDMANAARVHAAERGHDPTGLPLFAFGGAGPVHAAGVARALGTRTVIVPPSAGVMSAVGVLAAPPAADFMRSRREAVDDGTAARVEPLLRELERAGAELLARSGVREVVHERSVDMRYVGQGFEVTVPLPAGALDADGFRSAFEAVYVRKHGRVGPDVPLEAISWRVLTHGPVPPLRLGSAGSGADALKGRRSAFFGEWLDTPVYAREPLAAGARLDGPAIVEERESTTVVPPDARVVVSEDGSLVVSL